MCISIRNENRTEVTYWVMKGSPIHKLEGIATTTASALTPATASTFSTGGVTSSRGGFLRVVYIFLNRVIPSFKVRIRTKTRRVVNAFAD